MCACVRVACGARVCGARVGGCDARVCVCVACGARVCGVCGACVRSMCVWGVWCVCGFLSLTWTKL